MAGPKKVSQEEYDRLRSTMEDKYHYEELSDEDKERFDTEFDNTVTVDDNVDDDDMEEVDKGEFDDGHPHGRDDDDEDIR